MTGDLPSGLRSLHQLLGRVASAQTHHAEFASTDDGEHRALELQRFQDEVTDDATPDTMLSVRGRNIDQGVDLTGGLSKPAPALARMTATHRMIRRRALNPPQEHAHVRQQTRVSEELLTSAENRYAAGGTLREIANDLGISRERLATLLRARGVRLRGATPSDDEVREMARLYAAGEARSVICHLNWTRGEASRWTGTDAKATGTTRVT